MATIKIVKKSDLSIQSSYKADAPEQHKYGGPWGRAEETVHLAVPEAVDEDCAKAVLVPAEGVEGEEGYVAEHIVIEEDADLKAAKNQRGRDDKLAELRKQRDVRLDEADNQLKKHVDSDPSAVATEADWKSHRIALRDLTDSYKDAEDSSKGTAALDAYAADLSDFNAWPVEPA